MLVSNTSTLVLLAKIGCLEDFIEISPTIEIPAQVKREALFDKDSYYARLITNLTKNKKIKVIQVKSPLLNKVMQDFNLDAGEAAAYAMFDANKHQAILTDDGELIKLCKLEKIGFICAMAVVIVLYENKKLSREQALMKLEKLNEIGRYSEKICRHFKKEVE